MAGPMPLQLRVPVVSWKTVTMPGAIVALRKLAWAGTAIFTDIDDTWLGVPDIHVQRINVLNLRMLSETLDLAEKTKVAFVTAADYPLQKKRVVQPIIDQALREKRGKLLTNVALCANRGSIVGLLDESGAELLDVKTQYVDQHGIATEDIPLLEKLLDEVINEWMRVTGYAKDAIRFEPRPLPPGFEGLPDFKTNRLLRPPNYPINWPLAQVSIKPFPPDSRQIVVGMLERAMAVSSLGKKYELNPGGRSTIDLTRRGVNKRTGILWLMDRWGIRVGPIADIDNPGITPVIGCGDEFWVKSKPDLNAMDGGDMTMLDVDNLLALAFNRDRELLQQLIDYGHKTDERTRRLIPMGSGPSAALSFVTWANGKNGNSGNDNSLTVPIEEKIPIDVPPPVVSFAGTARTRGMITISASLLAGFKFGKELPDFASLDPTLDGISNLLIKGLPFAVLSGGDYSERALMMFRAIKEALEKRVKTGANARDILRAGMIFYTNGGAVKARPEGEDLRVDEAYTGEHVMPADLRAELGRILDEVARDYRDQFRRMHAQEHPSEDIRVETRFRGTQMSLLPVLNNTRRWILDRMQDLKYGDIEDQLAFHLGGYAFDFTLAQVSKGLAVTDAVETFKSRDQVLVFGNDFRHHFYGRARTLNGIDNEIFQSAASDLIVQAIALNADQKSVPPDHPKVFRGGCEIVALNEWLKYLNAAIQ